MVNFWQQLCAPHEAGLLILVQFWNVNDFQQELISILFYAKISVDAHIIVFFLTLLHIRHILIYLSMSFLPGSWISVPVENKGHPPQHESTRFQQHLLLRKHTSSCLDAPVFNPHLAPAASRVQWNSALTLIRQVCRHWPLLPVVSPQMDPIQKAVMTHTFGPPMVKTKRPIISCNVCQIRFNSEVRRRQQLWGQIHGSEGQTPPFFL